MSLPSAERICTPHFREFPPSKCLSTTACKSSTLLLPEFNGSPELHEMLLESQNPADQPRKALCLRRQSRSLGDECKGRPIHHNQTDRPKRLLPRDFLPYSTQTMSLISSAGLPAPWPLEHLHPQPALTIRGCCIPVIEPEVPGVVQPVSERCLWVWQESLRIAQRLWMGQPL